MFTTNEYIHRQTIKCPHLPGGLENLNILNYFKNIFADIIREKIADLDSENCHFKPKIDPLTFVLKKIAIFFAEKGSKLPKMG
jgi:hypothetical protein